MTHVLPGVLWTLALHSTAFLGLAWVAARRYGDTPAVRERIWLGAVLASLIGPALHGGLAAALVAGGASRNTLALKGSAGPMGALEVAASTPIGPDRWPGWVVALTLAWLAVAMGLTAMGWARRRRAVAALDRVRAPEALARELDAVARELGVRRPVRLTTSARLATPVALGSSEVCVPGDFSSTVPAAERTALFGHEVAHLRRRDHARFALLDAACGVLFFQPLAWLAREEARETAEMACDAAGTTVARSPVTMVRALERLARRYRGDPAAQAAALASPSLLVRRVRRIAAEPADQPARTTLNLGLATAGLAVLLLAPGVGGAVRVNVASQDAPMPWSVPTSVQGVVEDESRWKTVLRLPSGDAVRIEGVNAAFDGRQIQIAPGGYLSVTQETREGERRVTWVEDTGAFEAAGPFVAGQEPEGWAVEMLRLATR